MPVFGDAGSRMVGMPRVQPAPEHNLIQNPEMVRSLQRVTGTRQAHMMPALSEGLQPVVLMADVRDNPLTARPESYSILHEVLPNGVDVKRAHFYNPSNSEKIAVLRRLHVYMAEDIIEGGPPEYGPVSYVYNLVPLNPIVPNTHKGIRLVSGYQTSVAGLPPPPPLGSDLFPTRSSAMGYQITDPIGIDGGYIWRGIIGGAKTLGGSIEILENFNTQGGPRVIVFPGGSFQSYAIDTNFHGYVNLWWDEYPLT